MRRYAFSLVCAVMMGVGTAHAAPLFPDLGDHPARAAVETLSGKGIVEGYPDGTFKGNRAATRYEVGEMIARFVALEEKAHAGLATKSELAELDQIVKDLGVGAGALETRTGHLETELDSLNRRVKAGGKNKGF